MQNELHLIAEDMVEDYMKNFWIQLIDKVYTGSLVVQVLARQDTVQQTVRTTSTHGSSTQFICDRAHSLYLESQMAQLRIDCANIRTDFGEQLRQQGGDIQEVKTMVRQILQYVGRPHVRFY